MKHKGTLPISSPARGRGFCFSRLAGRLRFKHLSLLVALDEHQNLHRAAKAVYLAQPSASKLVLDLERMLGHTLFDRLPSGMKPTELGRVVLAFAHRTLRDLRRMAGDFDNRTAGREGYLTVSTNMDVACEVVARTMSKMKELHPTLSVTLLGDTGESIVGRLLDAQTDMAIGYISDVPADGRIQYEEIGHENLCVVARSHHPLCMEKHLTLAALERAAWILPPIASSLSLVIEQCLMLAGMRVPDNTVESNSATATLGILLSSDAVTIMPESVIRHYIRANILVRLSASVGGHLLSFGVLTRKGEPACPVVIEFIRFLRRQANRSDTPGTEESDAAKLA